ncbi:invasion associated locus B family protein, partial [Bacillus amyloliquefaciens]|nr:invasion associated locus B family protein [Bacillus amyloliquefaciens]
MFLAKSSMAKPLARPLRVAAFLAMAGLGAG